MGLLDQIQSGALFTRNTVSFSNVPVSGSITGLGYSYILLGVTADKACRVRLYSDSSSVALDNSRPSASINYDERVGLVFDGTITSDELNLKFDPPIVGTTFSEGKTWYNLSGSDTVNTTFTYYPIELLTGSRHGVNLTFSAGASLVQGTFSAPKSFILLSASASTPNRLRLYATSSGISVSEIVRATGSIPADNSKLIVEMLFDSGGFQYILSPSLESYNLNEYPTGTNTYSYIFQTVSASAVVNSASLFLYPVEN